MRIVGAVLFLWRFHFLTLILVTLKTIASASKYDLRRHGNMTQHEKCIYG